MFDLTTLPLKELRRRQEIVENQIALVLTGKINITDNYLDYMLDYQEELRQAVDHISFND